MPKFHLKNNRKAKDSKYYVINEIKLEEKTAWPLGKNDIQF